MLEAAPVGVIGLGVVGDAVRHYFEAVREQEVLVYDTFKRPGSIEAINRAEVVFVCVPTPYSAGVGFDDSAIEESLTLLRGAKTVVIKSTVIPGSTAAYQRRYERHTVLFNPEFLRDRTAQAYFLQPDRQLVGYCEGGADTAHGVLEMLPRAPYEAALPATAAELIKYATNAFLALKVTFANELFDLSEALGADYEDLRQGIAVDARIGGSHLDVLDGGYRGYGGKCLPKDTLALLDLAADLALPLEVLEAAHAENQRLRAAVPFERRLQRPSIRERLKATGG